MAGYVFDLEVLGAISDLIVVFLGGVLTLLAARAARRTNSDGLKLFAIGFAVITLGTLVGLGARSIASAAIGTLLRSLITAIGFALLAYSIYARELEPGEDTEIGAPGD